jgi:hypothetical protein
MSIGADFREVHKSEPDHFRTDPVQKCHECQLSFWTNYAYAHAITPVLEIHKMQKSTQKVEIL